jgi:hypothetical protein
MAVPGENSVAVYGESRVAAVKKVARVDVARRLTEAIWHMLTKREAFAPTVAMPA